MRARTKEALVCDAENSDAVPQDKWDTACCRHMFLRGFLRREIIVFEKA